MYFINGHECPWRAIAEIDHLVHHTRKSARYERSHLMKRSLGLNWLPCHYKHSQRCSYFLGWKSCACTHKHMGDTSWIIWSRDNAGSVLMVENDDKVLVKWKTFFKVWELDYRIDYIEIVVCNMWCAHIKDDKRIENHTVELKVENIQESKHMGWESGSFWS